MTLRIDKRDALERYRSLMRATEPGQPFGLDRAIQLAIEFTELIAIAEEVQTNCSRLAAPFWHIRVLSWRLGMHARTFAFAAYELLQPTSQSGAVTAPLPLNQRLETLALTAALLIRHRKRFDDFSRIRRCVDAANRIEKAVHGTPPHIRGLLECGRAYLAWKDAPQPPVINLGCEEPFDDAASHLDTASSFFDRALAPFGGSLSKLPTRIDSKNRSFVGYMALLAADIAQVRMLLRVPPGDWTAVPGKLRAAMVS